MFSTYYILCSLTLPKLRTEGQRIYTENLRLTEKIQTEIKILGNPGLA